MNNEILKIKITRFRNIHSITIGTVTISIHFVPRHGYYITDTHT